MDSDRVQCPFCIKRVTLRQDGKLPVHRRTNRMTKGGSPCVASEVPFEEARQLKAEGKKPASPKPPRDLPLGNCRERERETSGRLL